MDAEERYLKSRKCYKIGREEFLQGIPLEEPPFYLVDQDTDAWMMGWRAEEYLYNAGK